jgi:cysteine-rich repeat protein
MISKRRPLYLLLVLSACAVDADSTDPLANDGSVCGNRVVEQGEACDDGNQRNGDGCNRSCETEDRAICGNGELEEGEECDDGNKTDGDGCNRACYDEALLNCGNEQADAGEECDDGNRVSGDGCDDRCQAEGAACGNRFRSPGGGESVAEECDDGNTEDGDGCSSTCTCEDQTNDDGNDAQTASSFDFESERTDAMFGCGDVDMWSIQVAEAGIFRFFTESTTDPVCTLEDSNGETLSGDDDGGEELNCSVAMPMEVGETYYLKVRHYNAEWGTGLYTIGSERLPDDDHGNSAETATPIEALPYEQAARFDWGRDFDYYSLVAPATGQLTVMTESELDPMCRIMSGEEMLAENDDIDAESRNYDCRMALDVEQGQELTIVVAPFHNPPRQPLGVAGDYTLIVRQ